MHIIRDATNYKAEYEKALLTEALSDTTLKTKTTLLAFSSILLAVSVYGLQVKQIPGLGVDISAIAPDILIGVLALSAGYLLIRFVMCFLQDYYRWHISKGIASLDHSGEVLEKIQEKLQEIEQKCNSLERFFEDNDFLPQLEFLIKSLRNIDNDVRGVGRRHRFLFVIQYIRFWVIDFAVPLVVSIIALSMSVNPVINLLKEVWRALYTLIQKVFGF